MKKDEILDIVEKRYQFGQQSQSIMNAQFMSEIKELKESTKQTNNLVVNFDKKFDLFAQDTKQQLEELVAQTTKTNGRVSRLEYKMSRVQYILLVIAAISVTLAVIYYPQVLEIIKWFV